MTLLTIVVFLEVDVWETSIVHFRCSTNFKVFHLYGGQFFESLGVELVNDVLNDSSHIVLNIGVRVERI